MDQQLSPGTKVLRLVDTGLAELPWTSLPDSIEEVDLRGNCLTSIPLAVQRLPRLKLLNMAGNKLHSVQWTAAAAAKDSTGATVPPPIEHLHLGGNELDQLDESLAVLAPTLTYLYLGGNRLKEVPNVVAKLDRLKSLYLNSNQITSLPTEMVHLNELVSLHLQYNHLVSLPVELLALKRLQSLSVRGNPLMTNFVEEFVPGVPSLKELAARVVHARGSVSPLPIELATYVQMAHVCVGCKKASFADTSFSHIEFLDVCGSYHVPFLQFLCSQRCVATPTIDPTIRLARLRKVLLDTYNPDNSASVEDVHRELLETMSREDGGMD